MSLPPLLPYRTKNAELFFVPTWSWILDKFNSLNLSGHTKVKFTPLNYFAKAKYYLMGWLIIHPYSLDFKKHTRDGGHGK